MLEHHLIVRNGPKATNQRASFSSSFTRTITPPMSASHTINKSNRTMRPLIAYAPLIADRTPTHPDRIQDGGDGRSRRRVFCFGFRRPIGAPLIDVRPRALVACYSLRTDPELIRIYCRRSALNVTYTSN